MKRSIAIKIVVTVVSAVISAFLIAYLVPEDEPEDSPATIANTIKLITLDHPAGVFTMKYPSSMKGVYFFSHMPRGNTGTFIGFSWSFSHFIKEFSFELKIKQMIVEVRQKKLEGKWHAQYFFDELKNPPLLSYVNGFTSKESILTVQESGIPLIYPHIRITLIDTSAVNYNLLVMAEIPIAEWNDNKAIWLDSFRSIKINPVAAMAFMSLKPKSMQEKKRKYN